MSSAEISMIIAGIGQTLLMVFSSTFFGYVFGLPLGVLLYVSDKDGTDPTASYIEYWISSSISAAVFLSSS